LVFGRIQVDDHGRDRNSRLLGRVYYRDLDVNAEMVREGAAWVYRKYCHEPELLPRAGSVPAGERRQRGPQGPMGAVKGAEGGAQGVEASCVLTLKAGCFPAWGIISGRKISRTGEFAMPLTTDEKMLTLSRKVIEAFDKVNRGPHPGFRPAHAKGILLTGEFKPSPKAASLTRAPHVQRASTRVTARFSDFAGVPSVADNDAQNASPRGFAVRFHLAEHVHTDIVAHSVDTFPSRTAEEFLEFINALIATNPTGPHPNAIEQFLGTHPAALAFVQAPKPIPTSFARESFFTVSAFRFTNAEGAHRYGRYGVQPIAGNEYLDDAAAAKCAPDFLFDEIGARVVKEPATFRVVVQLAEDGDITDDATVRWPESRQLMTFGEISLTAVAPNNAAEQQHIIFDPIPRVDGIEASADPLFEPRANIYLMSGRRRREAGKATGA
jgi:catalase